jgi:type I restriction enzyme M protein
MKDEAFLTQRIFDAARAKGINAMEVLPTAIATCFGSWILRRTVHTREDVKSAFFLREPNAFQDLILGQVSDAENEEAFRSLFEEKIFDQMFDCLYSISAEYVLSDDELISVQEHLIQTLLERYYKQEYTPGWLHKLAVLILQPIEGNFYDGTAGAGDSVSAAFRFSKERNGNLRFYAAEINQTLRHILALRAHMNGIDIDFSHNNTEADGVPSPPQRQIDLSVMFPPFGDSRILEEYNIPKAVRELTGDAPVSRDWLFPLIQLASLSSTGKGICRVFNGMLFNSKYKPLRKRLIEMNVLDAIISLPANSLPFSAVPISLLVFDKSRKENAAVKMLDAAPWITGKFELSGNRKTALSDEAFNDLICAFRQGTQVRLTPPEDLRADNLLPQQYYTADAFEKVKDENLGFVHISNTPPPDWIAFGEVSQIYHGINTAMKSYGNSVHAEIIRLSNVRDGKLLLDNIEPCIVTDNGRLSRYRVQTDDILISCKGPAIKMCMIPDDAGKRFLLLSQHFIGIRIDKTRFDPKYIYYFLKSPVGRKAVASCQIGSSIVMIRVKDIEQIRLPCIPLLLQKAYVEQLSEQENDIEQKFFELKKELQSAQWDFYMKIGLGQVITKEERYERN